MMKNNTVKAINKLKIKAALSVCFSVHKKSH